MTLLKGLKEFVHLLPGFYIQVVGVVTGKSALAIENQHITYQQGVLMLGSYCLVLIVLSLLIEKNRVFKFY